jgi:hypothetical protein
MADTNAVSCASWIEKYENVFFVPDESQKTFLSIEAKCLEKVCTQGHVQFVQWLTKTHPQSLAGVRKAILNVHDTNNFDALTWIVEQFHLDDLYCVSDPDSPWVAAWNRGDFMRNTGSNVRDCAINTVKSAIELSEYFNKPNAVNWLRTTFPTLSSVNCHITEENLLVGQNPLASAIQ